MPQGTISRLNHARGFGFLTTAEGNDLFFHRTNVQDIPFARLQVGDRVVYEIQYTTRGPRAGNIQLHVPAAQLQVNLAVHELDPMVQFYVHTLGFKQMVMNPGYILLHRGALIIGLKTDDLLWHPAFTEQPRDEVVRGIGVELVLEVSDIEQFYTHIQDAGVTIQEPLTDRPWGVKDFRVLDPEGYYWRVTSPRPMSSGPEDITASDFDHSEEIPDDSDSTPSEFQF